MTGLATWWRRAGGLLAACLVVLLAAAPVVDPLICRDEDSPAAAAQVTSAVAAVEFAATADLADHANGGVLGDHQGLCPHGHCHHVTPDIGSAPVMIVRLGKAAEPHGVLLAALPTSDPHFGLKRPPRA